VLAVAETTCVRACFPLQNFCIKHHVFSLIMNIQPLNHDSVHHSPKLKWRPKMTFRAVFFITNSTDYTARIEYDPLTTHCMHHLTRGISSLRRSVNLILFTLLLVHQSWSWAESIHGSGWVKDDGSPHPIHVYWWCIHIDFFIPSGLKSDIDAT